MHVSSVALHFSREVAGDERKSSLRLSKNGTLRYQYLNNVNYINIFIIGIIGIIGIGSFLNFTQL